MNYRVSTQFHTGLYGKYLRDKNVSQLCSVTGAAAVYWTDSEAVSFYHNMIIYMIYYLFFTDIPLSAIIANNIGISLGSVKKTLPRQCFNIYTLIISP